MNSSEAEPGVVWFLSGDLMFASRVRGAAENAGLAFRLAGKLPREASGPGENLPAGEHHGSGTSPDGDNRGDDKSRGPDATGGPVRFVVVDLATRAGLASDAVSWAASLSPPPMTLAYGPHVQAQRLSDAREAGIDHVMTRGQFDSRLASLFTTPG